MGRCDGWASWVGGFDWGVGRGQEGQIGNYIIVLSDLIIALTLMN